MNSSNPSRMRRVFGWFDDRLPISAMWRSQLTRYPAPKNFNLWYFFGSLAMVVLVLQLATGLFLAIHYQPNPDLAYWSVLRGIERDSRWGWLIRDMHIVGASAFFLLVYLHMYRGIMYGSYKKPRELLWLIGIFIYLALAAEAFLGYLLPWGQMSYWGSAVVTNFVTAVPVIGKPIATWLRGSFVVGLPTLNRFFIFHVFLVPVLLLALVLVHLIALHHVGSNNPDGVEIHDNVNDSSWPRDGIPFHPYYTVKDLFGVSVFFVAFFWFVFYNPGGWGLLLDKLNYTPANILHTPADIHPLWFFLPFYAMLRGVPDKLYGILAFGASFVLLACLPLLDRSPVRSIRYRSVLYKLNILMMAFSFLWLGYIAHGFATEHNMVYGLHVTEVFYSTFLLLPFFNRRRSARVKIVWLFAAEAVVWLIDLWMYSIHAHGWDLMLLTDWIPTLYLLLLFGLAIVFPALAHDRRQLPQRLTAGGLFH